MICLETERLILRDYREDDFEEYYRLKSDSGTMYYLQDIQLHTREEACEDFQKVLEDRKRPDRKFYFLHVELKDSHKQVGSVGYTVTGDTPVGKMVGAGYFIYPKFWGKGYTTEAFGRVLEYAFSEGNVYKVSTGCLAENAGSERVMQKCGMIREAEHIDYEWHDGKMKTRREYRLLKREWSRMKSAKEEVRGEMVCKIRKWKMEDAADLAAVISSKKVQDNLRDGLPYPYTEQDGREYISAMLSADENETFAFAVTADGRVVGSIGVFRQGNVHRRTAELGYYIAESYWGRGIMTEAVKQICRYVFENSDIIRIYAEPFAYNEASCRVLEKAGFQYEGTLRSNAVKNGKVIDMKMYSCLKEI